VLARARFAASFIQLHQHDCTPHALLQFVDIATGEKASNGFDHRASVSVCGCARVLHNLDE
jgi:hypothetical protein